MTLTEQKAFDQMRQALKDIAEESFDKGAVECANHALTAANAVSESTSKQSLHVATGWAAPKNRYAVPVLFNPYTGEPRDVRDVQSDPQGILIVPLGNVEMLAANAVNINTSTGPKDIPAPANLKAFFNVLHLPAGYSMTIDNQGVATIGKTSNDTTN